MAGVIKVVLAMQHRVIPPAINISQLNPKIDWDRVPVYVPTAPVAWPDPAPGQPRRAGVNAFGIGGLNMHLVLDEFDETLRPLAAASPSAGKTASDDHAIAIVGMGCVLPGAGNLPKYWELLAAPLPISNRSRPCWPCNPPPSASSRCWSVRSSARSATPAGPRAWLR
jgi:acyl transferase domain-containing protein